MIKSEILLIMKIPGFVNSNIDIQSPLKKILGVKNGRGRYLSQISLFNVPEYWQPVVQSSYFGKYVRSSVYTRGRAGDRMVTWKTIINEPGYYDIYTYMGKQSERMTTRAGIQGGPGGPGDQAQGNRERAPIRICILRYIMMKE